MYNRNVKKGVAFAGTKNDTLVASKKTSAPTSPSEGLPYTKPKQQIKSKSRAKPSQAKHHKQSESMDKRHAVDVPSMYLFPRVLFTLGRATARSAWVSCVLKSVRASVSGSKSSSSSAFAAADCGGNKRNRPRRSQAMFGGRVQGAAVAK